MDDYRLRKKNNSIPTIKKKRGETKKSLECRIREAMYEYNRDIQEDQWLD